MYEFIPLTSQGRRFHEEFVVRLGDSDPRGQLRVDALARLLQDIATDDWADGGVGGDDTWLVRRTALRWVGPSWPTYLNRVTLTTWCSGTGPAWAERRTDLAVDGVTLVETEALWVPVNQAGQPVRLRESFFRLYGESARARRVSGRVSASEVPEGADRRPWTLRASDLDLVGHVNNAALWQAVTEVVAAPARFVAVIHHGSIERDDKVVLASSPGSLWLLVDDVVRVSASYEP